MLTWGSVPQEQVGPLQRTNTDNQTDGQWDRQREMHRWTGTERRTDRGTGRKRSLKPWRNLVGGGREEERQRLLD